MLKIYHFITAIILVLFVVSSSVSAQFLNNSFEDWDMIGNPVNWFTGNAPGVIMPVTQSSDAQDGSSSAKVEILEYVGGYYSGILQSSDADYTVGHPIDQNYSSVNGYLKFAQSGSAVLSLVAIIYDAEFVPIGAGAIELAEPVSNWTPFQVPIDNSPGEAASVIFQISIFDTSAGGVDPNSVGSYALIDNLSLGTATDVEEDPIIPTDYSLSQNYPNPFNPSTTISYTLPNSESVELIVYDVLGNKVAVLDKGYKAGGKYSHIFDSSNLSSGNYFYTLRAGNFVQTKKMLLIK